LIDFQYNSLSPVPKIWHFKKCKSFFQNYSSRKLLFEITVVMARSVCFSLRCVAYFRFCYRTHPIHPWLCGFRVWALWIFWNNPVQETAPKSIVWFHSVPDCL
jgi:hypothetical protein